MIGEKTMALKHFLSIVLIMFNTLFLCLLTIPIYVIVNYIIAEHTSVMRLEMLLNNKQHLTYRLKQAEEITLSILTDKIFVTALDSESSDEYESIITVRNLDVLLDNYTFVKPDIRSIHIYNDKLSRLPGPKQRIFPLSEIPWKNELVHLETTDSIWLPSRKDTSSVSGSKDVITYIMKVSDRRTNFQCYIEVNLLESSLNNLIKSDQNNNSYNRVLLVIDQEGQLMSKISTFINNLNLKDVDWLKSLPQNKNEGFSKISIEKNSYLYIYTAQKQPDWRLVEIIPTKDVYASARKVQTYILIIGIFALLLTFPLASYLSNRIMRPVSKLLEGFRKVENGNFDASTEKHFIFEFHQLTISFKSMVNKLETLLNRLNEEHNKKRDAEFRALQSQINPHFLYNTLDLINWMAAMKGNHDISVLAVRLSRLFRISLSKGNTFISLKEELEHAMLYSQIQQERFKNKFVYKEKVDPRLKLCHVPKIIIQPFIENSIIHGFNGSMEEEAIICVTGEILNKESYHLIIEDNGCGLSDDVDVLKSRPQNQEGSLVMSGYGVQNVNERIQMYFGLKYGVELQNVATRGVRVVITLPMVESYSNSDKKFPGHMGDNT